MNEKELILAAASILMDTVLDLIQGDAHTWSSRPCPTCQSVTIIAGRPFGCVKVRLDREARENGN